MFKYLTIHPDKVPKDLPFDTKIISRRVKEVGYSKAKDWKENIR